MLNDAPENVDMPSNTNIIQETLKMAEIVSNVLLTKNNDINCSTNSNQIIKELDFNLQNSASTSQNFEIKNNIKNNLTTSSTLAITKSMELKSLLNRLKRKIKIKCNCHQTIPFIVEGGSENAQLIYVGAVLRADLIGHLNFGDVILTVDNM